MREQIVQLMASVFGVHTSEIEGGIVFGKFYKWDSLRHMNLIVALEEEFNIAFDEEEITDMLSLDLVVEIVKNKTQD